MQRATIGAISLTLFVVALVLWVTDPSSSAGLGPACVRVGILLAVVWLAHPQLVTLPRWLTITIVGALAVVCWKPKALLFALPVLVILAVMRPRWGGKAGRNSSSSRP